MESIISGRVILHCDCNNFFASVELIDKPELRDKPVAVAGDPKERSGIILAKNMLAKQCGVKTAETIWQAKKKCPDLVLLPPHMSKYQEVSKEINNIYLSVTDQVEPFSVDESWLDVTGSRTLFGSGVEIADMLREKIKKDIGITISVGVSDNKIWAKLGSDYKKPDATTLITKENAKDILYPLPVGDMLYVGKSTEKILLQSGIDTIGKLIQTPQETIHRLLGKSGDELWINASGRNMSSVKVYKFSDNSGGDEKGEKQDSYHPFHNQEEDDDKAKSISRGNTFSKDLVGSEEFRTGLLPLCESVGRRLREHKLKCSTVTVFIRDTRLKTISRQKTLTCSTNLTRDIYNAACEIVADSWNESSPVRQFTVAATNLQPEDIPQQQQLSFFDNEAAINPKQEKFQQAIDSVRSRFGRDSIKPVRLSKPQTEEEKSQQPESDNS